MSLLKRKINLIGLIMIVIGSCIGSGIFITSSQVTKILMNPSQVLFIWILGGLVSLCGALTFAELGGLFPKSGGVYVYIREGYGRMVGFLYGWIILLIVTTGAIAALSVAFADFLSYFFEISQLGKQLVAIFLIIVLTGINVMGVSLSQILTNVFSSIKIFAIVLILFLGIIYGTAGESTSSVGSINLFQNPGGNIMSLYLAAFVGVFWSFGGWHHSTYISGEVIDAQRTVPKAMVIGVTAVTILYVLANIAYFLLLPVEGIAASNRIAADAIGSIFEAGGSIVSFLVICSLVGTIFIYTMSAPRIYFAMAKDGIFFKVLTNIHPKYGTPYVSMIFQSVWAIFLILIWGNFEKLITFVTFMDILFMMLAAVTIFIFRIKRSKEERPYKTIGYPVIPAIFIIITCSFVVNLILSLSKESFVGLGILLVGVLTYFYFERQNQNK